MIEITVVCFRQNESLIKMQLWAEHETHNYCFLLAVIEAFLFQGSWQISLLVVIVIIPLNDLTVLLFPS